MIYEKMHGMECFNVCNYLRTYVGSYILCCEVTQHRQPTYNVTLRCVRVTTVAVYKR